MTDYRSRSLWLDGVPGELEPRPALPGPLDVDVAIVGAGFTGLWTAYYLKKADPHLRVAVLEREIAGFGASGRNGGWCSSFFAGSRETHGEASRARRGDRPAEGDVRHRRRGRARRRRRGHRRALPQGRRLRPGLQPGAARARAARRSSTSARGASARTTTGCLGAEEARSRIDAPAVSAPTSRRTAPPSTRRAWRAASPTSSSGWAWPSTSARPPCASRRAASTTPAGTVTAEVVVRATEGYTPSAARLRARRSCRSTR